jgi:pimeloyl-ACP methyl ester carboxylesterase
VAHLVDCERLVVAFFLATSMSFAPASAGAQQLRRAGFVGVVAVPIPDAARSAKEHGILVQGLVDGGSAKEAGIEPNDIIWQVNDHRVTDVADFVQTVLDLRAGDTAVIRLRRGEVELTQRVPVKPRPLEAAPDVNVLYQAIPVDDSLRRVIVTAPKAEGRHPAVLYQNGVGCFSQESLDLSSPDARLLYGLTRAGFVTMRVEKSGMGDSQGPPCASTQADLHAEVRSYLAGLRRLKQEPFVDPGRVLIIGLSLGGVEAPLVAQQEPVKGVAVINTVAKPLFEYLLATLRRQALLRHTPYDEVDRDMLLSERCNHRLLIEQQTPEQILEEMPQCQSRVSYPAPYTLMQQWAALNLAEQWKRVDAPVLIAYGTSDFISSIADDAYLADLINSFHPGHATLRAITGMDHYLTKAATMEESISRPPGARGEFEPAVLEVIEAWSRRLVSTQVSSVPASTAAPQHPSRAKFDSPTSLR